jgi:hypothetical protein
MRLIKYCTGDRQINGLTAIYLAEGQDYIGRGVSRILERKATEYCRKFQRLVFLSCQLTLGGQEPLIKPANFPPLLIFPAQGSFFDRPSALNFLSFFKVALLHFQVAIPS